MSLGHNIEIGMRRVNNIEIGMSLGHNIEIRMSLVNNLDSCDCPVRRCGTDAPGKRRYVS